MAAVVHPGARLSALDGGDGRSCFIVAGTGVGRLVHRGEWHAAVPGEAWETRPASPVGIRLVVSGGAAQFAEQWSKGGQAAGGNTQPEFHVGPQSDGNSRDCRDSLARSHGNNTKKGQFVSRTEKVRLGKGLHIGHADDHGARRTSCHKPGSEMYESRGFEQ